MGIPAALLNSTLAASEQSAIIARARGGALSAAVSFAGAVGAAGHDRVAAARAGCVFCD